MRRALPLALFIVFLLWMSIDVYSEEIDDEKLEEMLQNILNKVDLPVPSNFQGNHEFRSGLYVYDYGGSYWDEFEAYLSITKKVKDWIRVNGTYLYLDKVYQTHYTYWHRIQAYIKIYIVNREPSIGCRYAFEQDVNEIKNKYNVYEESDNRLIAYSIEIGDWESTIFREIDRDYTIYCLEYFSIGDYEVYVKVQIEIDVDTSSIKKETKYEKNIVYEINPESLIINELESIQLYSSFTDDLTNEVKNALQQLIKEEKGEEEQKEQEEQQYVTRNITIYFEYDFDLDKGKGLIVNYGNYGIKPSPFYNVTVEHVATGYKEYFNGGDFYFGRIEMNKLFNLSLINLTGDGLFRIWIDVFTDDKSYIDRINDDSLLPQKAFIECDIGIDGENITKLTIKKARHCWIKVSNEWEILYDKNKKTYEERDGTDGFEIRLRSVLAWEKRIKYCIYKFLQESNFYSNVKDAYKFDLAMIDSIPIYYERGVTPGYDPSLNIINMSNPAGSIYTYDSDEFDSLFHEFAHALKELAYHFVDKDVDDYLGGSHPNTCAITNIYFAFEEGHSEFFASLMVDYVKEKGLIEEQYLSKTDYHDAPCHFGKEGDKIEGAVAGLLLNGLYLNYVKYKYKDNPQAKTYEIFAKACELCNKYLKHYPYSIHDVIPFIVAIEPECNDELTDVDLI